LHGTDIIFNLHVKKKGYAILWRGGGESEGEGMGKSEMASWWRSHSLIPCIFGFSISNRAFSGTLPSPLPSPSPHCKSGGSEIGTCYRKTLFDTVAYDFLCLILKNII